MVSPSFSIIYVLLILLAQLFLVKIISIKSTCLVDKIPHSNVEIGTVL